MGFFSRLVSGLSKTRDTIIAGIDSIFSGSSSIDDDFYEELEELLIMGDLGINTTTSVLDNLKEKVKELKIKDPSECRQLLIDSIKKQMQTNEEAYEFENKKSVVLLIGVNGVGKSSLTGVLAAESNDLGVIIDTDKITASLNVEASYTFVMKCLLLASTIFFEVSPTTTIFFINGDNFSKSSSNS